MGVADRPWCWITTWRVEWTWDNAGVIQQFTFFYIPLLVIFIYNCVGKCEVVRVLGEGGGGGGCVHACLCVCVCV